MKNVLIPVNNRATQSELAGSRATNYWRTSDSIVFTEATGKVSEFKIEIFGGGAFTTANWPSIGLRSDLRMFVYQSREFIDVWMQTIGKRRRIATFFILIKDASGTPIFYLPVGIERRLGVRLLRFLDAGVADYNAPGLAPHAVFSRDLFTLLWAKILSLLPFFDAADLRKIPQHVLGLSNPLLYLNCTPHSESGHSTLISSLHTDTDARGSVKRLRKDLHRNCKRLMEIGTLDFVTNPSEKQLSFITERLIELKRKRYTRMSGSDFLALPGTADFYREMMSSRRLGQISQLSALTINGEVASAHLGFLSCDRFYYVFPAFDSKFAKFRVGHMLLQKLIDDASQKNLTTFDLGIGNLAYKRTWASQPLALFNHEQAFTAVGNAYLLARRLKHLLSSLRSTRGL